MKKIIWVFGESATGKRTLINNLYDGDEKTLNTFDMQDKKIDISAITVEDSDLSRYTNVVDNNIYDDSLMEDDNLYFNRENAIKRRKCIMYDTDNFINSDDDILLIKGQINDVNVRRGDILNYFLNKYCGYQNLEIETFILQVANKEELAQRVQTKEWFKEMTDEKEKERLLNKIPLKKGEHKQEVMEAFSNYPVTIRIYESSNNTYVLDNVINNNRKR